MIYLCFLVVLFGSINYSITDYENMYTGEIDMSLDANKKRKLDLF
jgi:hypothetical protein